MCRAVPWTHACTDRCATHSQGCACCGLAVGISCGSTSCAAARAGNNALGECPSPLTSFLVICPPMCPVQVAELGVPYVLMHMRGTPQDMQQRRHTAYGDVIADVAAELTQAANAAIAAGIEPWRLVLDPGLGFAKTHDGNLALLAGLPALRAALPPPLAHLPQLLGPSRKGFLGRLTGRQVAAERDWATAAAAALCVTGGANIIRAHNVEAVRDACRVADAARRYLP